MSLPKSLRGMDEEEEDDEAAAEEEEEEQEEGKERGNGVGEEEGQSESVPMEGGESQRRNGGLDETWGDISFSSDRGEGRGKDAEKRELQMNWHICKYLPEDGSCRSCFQVGGVLLVQF